MERRGGTRHCASCDREVHDLSRLTENEARRLLAAHEGRRLCGRLAVDEGGALVFRAEVSAPRNRIRAAAVAISLAAIGCEKAEPRAIAVAAAEPVASAAPVTSSAAPIAIEAPENTNSVAAPSASAACAKAPPPSGKRANKTKVSRFIKGDF